MASVGGVFLGVFLSLLAMVVWVWGYVLAWRFGPRVLALVILGDLLTLGLLWLAYPVWRLLLFAALMRWQPVRGLFQPGPPWPPSSITRGRRPPRYKSYYEPLPWDPGPCSS